MTVAIGTEATAPAQVAHPGYLAPVKFVGGQPVEPEPLAPTEDERWQPELSPNGPISIVLSQSSQLIVVYRNGIEIGRARLTVTGDAPLVNHALMLSEGPSRVPDPYVPDPTKFSWLRIGVPGHIGELRYPGRFERGCQNQTACRLRSPTEWNTDAGGDVVCDQ